MTNFGWIITRKYEAQDWTTFANGDVIATEDDIEKLIKAEATEVEIDAFVIREGELYHLPGMEKVKSLKEGLKFKKLYSITFETETI